jgi:ribosomal protein S18 acetylase RimI-like enzyme
MSTNVLAPEALWQRLLVADEAHLAYFAGRATWPGATLFTSGRADAPEFDLALIHRVDETEADATLRAIVDHFRARGRRPRVRLSPLSEPADWPVRLRRAGFGERAERRLFLEVPAIVRPVADPAVAVERVGSPAEVARFSAIQAAGFGLSAAHEAWDRALVRRHLTGDRFAFYLATLDGRAVGAGKVMVLPNGVAGLSSLATLPAARGRGVGTSLLARMIADARAAECDPLFGVVRPDGYAAGYYRRQGWAPLFETRTFALRG